MKQYKWLLVFLLFTSCDMEGSLEQERAEKRTAIENDYKIIIIDGCEYLEFSRNLTGTTPIFSITHKGNCSNSIHQ